MQYRLQETRVHRHDSTLEDVSRGRIDDARTGYRSAAEMQNNTQRVLIACSLWLHIGFIGAATLAAGLLQLFGGERLWRSRDHRNGIFRAADELPAASSPSRTLLVHPRRD